MTADTPTPYVPPDGVILTTMAEARRIGHGQTRPSNWPSADNVDWKIWSARSSELSDRERVWWRPTPERTVTIELPESVARELASYGGIGYLGHRTEPAVVQATRDAIARLDGDT